MHTCFFILYVGKNIFYLPAGTDYTAVMTAKIDSNVNDLKEKKKIEETKRLNEQLILECVGKVNREGSNIQGKLRTSTTEVQSQSTDCVISIGALKRSGPYPVYQLQESYRYFQHL